MTICVPFRFITVLRSVLLPFSVPFYYYSPFRFFCRLRLNGIYGLASVFYSRVIRTYVLATSIVVTATRLTLAVGSLVSLLALSCCDTEGVQRLQEVGGYTYMYHHRQGFKPGDIARKLQQEGIKATGRGIAKGRSQGSPGVEDRWNGTERNGPWNKTERTVERNGTDSFTQFLGKRCRRATQTERTIFRTFFRHVP